MDQMILPRAGSTGIPALHGIGNEAILTTSDGYLQSLLFLQTSARSLNLDPVLFSDKQPDKLQNDMYFTAILVAPCVGSVRRTSPVKYYCSLAAVSDDACSHVHM